MTKLEHTDIYLPTHADFVPHFDSREIEYVDGDPVCRITFGERPERWQFAPIIPGSVLTCYPWKEEDSYFDRDSGFPDSTFTFEGVLFYGRGVLKLPV